MKSLIVFIFLSVLIKGYAQTETPEQALARMEDKRIQAVVGHDSLTLATLYDDSYRGVLTTGRSVKKSGVIGYQLSNNPYIKISIEGVEATIHEDMGVVTGRQVNRSKSGTILGQSKFVRVYKKFGTAWRIVYSQATLVIEDK